MSPLPTYCDQRVLQEVLASPRTRRCLLKGCEQSFRPSHGWARYCSDACRQSARRWSQWLANRRYRASEHGKQQRRSQCQRNRQRRCQDPPAESHLPPTQAPVLGCEGYQRADFSKKFPCHRPGCYECFGFSARSPLKKFCSTLCQQALRVVKQREARWRRRLYTALDVVRWRAVRPP